jgi:CubicO group peptidase (beta-lactamase class C family)
MYRRPINQSSILALAAVVVFTSIPTAISARQTALQRGQSVSGTLAVGDTARYTVEVGDDYYVFGEVNQISVDVAVRVVDSTGSQVARFGGLGRGGERFARQFEDGGVYTLELIAEDEEEEPEAGDYSITLHRVEPLAKDPKQLTDQLMARFDGMDTPGAAVQVWRDGKTLYSKAYGMANLAYGIPFRPDTRTNIGSTSKQFTAFAVMLQHERGLLSLDDDIRKHIPELPGFGEDTIRVRHLITHTSGLREFINLVMMTGRRIDHGDWIDRSELIDIVKHQPALQNTPGAEWNYNNTAFGLAALIVERTSGKPFHVFMQENVFGPLGMTRTMVRPSPHDIVPDQSEGYTPGDRGYIQIGDLGGAVGAGGIYSSVVDLETWVQNYAIPRVGSREIFDEMMTKFILTDGDTADYGYGLSVGEQRGLKRINHGGADIAHRSMLVYYPEINAGITAQSNNAEFGSGVAFQLAEAFFGDAMEPEEDEEMVASANGDFDLASYDYEDFDDFVGRYALDVASDFIMTFTREDDSLWAQATGQPRFQIVPTSDSTFRLTAVDASVTFHRNDEGEVDGLTLHQGGDQHATRLDDGSGKWEPTVADLEGFVGRYFSEEIETFFDIGMENDTLVLRQRRMEEAKLAAGDETDEFFGGGFTFEFERDRSHRVVGFYLSNGRTRDVRFERVR